METSKSRIGRSMQFQTLIPMVVGILVCAIITLILLFLHYTDWGEEMEEYLVAEELKSLRRLSNSRARTLGFYFSDVAYDQSFLRNLYEDPTIASALNGVTAVDAYNTFDRTSYPDLTTSVYTASGALNANDQKIEILDYFLKPVYTAMDSIVGQMGFIKSAESLDYRYPLQDMNEIKTMTSCNGVSISKFDITCTDAYKTLIDPNYNFDLILHYEYGYLTSILKATDFDFSAFILKDNAVNVMVLQENYVFFMTQNDGDFVILVDSTSLDTLKGSTLSTALFPDDQEGQGLVSSKLVPLIQDIAQTGTTTKSYSFSGENVEYFSGIQKIEIDYIEGVETGFSAGVIVNKDSTLSDWNETVDDVIFTLIGQVSIFVTFILVSLISVWVLSRAIYNLVIVPLRDIEFYLLDKSSIKQVNKDYNFEANLIIDQLSLLDSAQKFINPHFLLHINKEVRVKNLRKAVKVFRGISNKRGEANAQNLIGNSYFEDRKFGEAAEAYNYAYELIKSLLEDINVQESKEQVLKPKSKKYEMTLMEEAPWESEREFLRKSLCKRIEQLCMAQAACIKSEIMHPLKIKETSVQIVNWHVEALECCLLAKIDIIDILKILIDIADVQLSMLYENSASEILDLVFDELLKIESEHRNYVDIDIGRLKRVGLAINDLNTINQFRIQGITFETCILKQKIYFRRGLILKEKDAYKEACEYFAKAIYEGDYFDPEIRESCTKELHKILSKYSLVQDVPFVEELNREIEGQKTGFGFLFAYEIEESPQVTNGVIDIIENLLTDSKVGATSLHSDVNATMEVIKRDFLRSDFEFFVENAETGKIKEHFYDSLAKVKNLFKGNFFRKVLVAIVDEISTQKGSTYLEDLSEALDSIDSIIVVETRLLGNPDFKEFITNQKKGKYIECSNGVGLQKLSDELSHFVN